MTRTFYGALFGLAILLACATFVVAQGGVYYGAGVRYVVAAQTVADNGGATAATGTIPALKSYVALTCSDTAGGCNLTLSETGARDGMVLTVVCLSNAPCTFTDSSGVQELSSTAALAVHESIGFLYVTDRWVETGRPDTRAFTEYFHACTTDGGGQYTTWDSNGTDDPTFAAVSGTNVTLCTAAFPDPGPKYLWNHYRLPSNWTGALDATFLWRTSATSGNVVWQLQTACAADGEVIDPAWNTASVVIDAAQGTTLWHNTAAITGVTTTGCVAGEMMFFRVARDGAHASDTLAASAQLIGVELKFRQ